MFNIWMMKEKKLDTYIKLRIFESQKKKWKQICEKKNITMTEFIISSVENKLSHSEKKEIITFIDKQVNIFSKIENNINQIAKIVNTEKSISEVFFKLYVSKLDEITRLKNEQNGMIKRLLYLMSK